MKQLHLMMDNLHGLKNVKQLILEKYKMYKKSAKEKNDPKIFDKINVPKTN